LIRAPLVLSLLAAMLLEAGLPLLFAQRTRRWLQLGWDDFVFGTVTFAVAGLLVLLPVVDWASRWASGKDWAQTTSGLAIWALALALLTATVEQTGRYLGLRLLFRGVRRTWSRAVLFGLGFGGLQAIFLVALPTLVRLGNYLLLSQINPFALGMTAREAVEFLAEQRELASMAVWRPFLQGAESATMVGLQTGLSVLVLQVFSRARRAWLFYAGALHTIGQASLLLGTVYLQPWLGLLGLAAVTTIACWWALRLRPQRRLVIPS